MDTRGEINKSGFVLLKTFHPDSNLAEIADRLGTAWDGAQDKEPHLLTPSEQSASTPNTYSGNYGLRGFPLHTDLAHWRKPPRYLVLRCKVAAPNVATMLLDGQTIIEKCGKSVLSRALVQPRRPLQGAIPLLRLYQQAAGDLGMLRWDQMFIKPSSKNGTSGFNQVREAIARERATPIYLDEPGDTLIIDNWRMLHGRSPVPKGSEGRVIERMYLEELN